MIRRFVFACTLALLFTLTLNAGTLAAWQKGNLRTTLLNDHAIDERLYFATIAKVGRGAPPLGHSSYIEHRADASAVSLAPVIEGLMMRFLGLPLERTVLLGDVLFPFLAVLALACGLMAAFKKEWFAGGAIALVVAGIIGIYWLRSSNPQLPLVLTFAWTGVVFALPPGSRAGLLLRGLLLGALTWVQVVYATFFVFADAMLLLGVLLERRSWSKSFADGLVYAGGVLLILWPRLFLNVPAGWAEDSIARMGVIHTRLPAAPRMQLTILLLLALLAGYRWWTARRLSDRLRRCVWILLGALLALNQPLLHGRDALFVSYYGTLTGIGAALTVAMLVSEILPKNARSWAAACAVVATLLTLARNTGSMREAVRAEAQAYEASGVPEVLAWLRDRPGTQVVAAPHAVSSRVPYETAHYDLFNEYGWNQPMEDRELAERYALNLRLVPSTEAADKTYTNVFGGYAGLTGAKRRAFCRLRRAILGNGDACVLDARTLIRHQELLPVVDHADIDVAQMMEKYRVSVVVTEKGQTLSAEMRRLCRNEKMIGTYGVWSCRTP